MKVGSMRGARCSLLTFGLTRVDNSRFLINLVVIIELQPATKITGGHCYKYKVPVG